MQLRESGRTNRPMWIMVAVAAVLQVALAPQISIAGGTVNFMVVLTVVLALSSDAGSAVMIGFFSGLFYDLTSAAPIGLMTLILTVAGFAVASGARGGLGSLSSDSIRFAAIAILAVNLVNGIALLIMGVEGDVLWALLGHGASSTVLDALVAAIFLALGGSSGPQRGFTVRPRTSKYKLTR